jgi:TonB family protein
VERILGTQFQPKLDDVTTKTAAQLLLAQYRAGVRRDVAQAAAEGRSVYEEPAEWRRTEVAVDVDATGKLIDARVVTPSGSSHLDALALDAVRATIAAAPPRTGKRSGVRFAIESAVSVMPPEVSAIGVAGPARQNGAALKLGKLRFDETTGRVSHPDFILKKTLQTRVKLIGADGY